MSNLRESIFNIPKNVRDDTVGYREKVKEFLDGRISPTDFRTYHVLMGVYEQRTAGKYMVRIRIAAGLVLPYQLEQIGRLSKTYGNGIVHVTTRQDIQIHDINIQSTPNVLEGLLEAGLSTEGSGGNSVRNITACPRAGACVDEVFDVAPYAIATTEYLLQTPSSFNLPRKYKIAFSGCSKDCALACVADLGFFAHTKNGIKGFAVYAGGGLGSNPSVAVKIEDFVEASEVFEVAEAIERLFDKYGDRANRHKARLRYVLARVGTEDFINLYRKEREILKAKRKNYATLKIRNISSGYPLLRKSVTVRLWLENGDIPAEDLSRVGQIAAKYGQGLVRTTQTQDLLITGVAKTDIDKVSSELTNLSIKVIRFGVPKVVSCTGAATCKLGTCLSKGLSRAITEKLVQNNFSSQESEEVIRISGCPNSCGNHHIASIGFQGRMKKVNEKLMPCYDVLVGAKIYEGQTRLAKKIGTVPAKAIPELLAQALIYGVIEKKKLKELVEKYSDFSSAEFPDEYYCDYGTTEPLPKETAKSSQTQL